MKRVPLAWCGTWARTAVADLAVILLARPCHGGSAAAWGLILQRYALDFASPKVLAGRIGTCFVQSDEACTIDCLLRFLNTFTNGFSAGECGANFMSRCRYMPLRLILLIESADLDRPSFGSGSPLCFNLSGFNLRAL